MTLQGRAKLDGVIGWSGEHSRSSRLHEHWQQHCQVDGAYIPLSARSGSISGFSAHKKFKINRQSQNKHVKNRQNVNQEFSGSHGGVHVGRKPVPKLDEIVKNNIQSRND